MSDTEDDNETIDSSGEGSAAQYNLATWPTTTDVAEKEMEKLRKEENPTHRIRPLPAKDIANKEVKPTDYQTMFKGALCTVFFTMTHWRIEKRDSHGQKYHLDQFAADIRHFSVVRLRKPAVTTPQKRRVGGAGGSPSKKARV